MSGRLLAALATAAVLGAVSAGLLLVGGPGTARLDRLDARREADLRMLVDRIESYRVREGHPPPDLAALESSLPDQVSTVDPVTGAAYGYETYDQGYFRVCAELATAATEAAARRPRHALPHSDRTLVRTSGPSGSRLCLSTAEAPEVFR